MVRVAALQEDLPQTQTAEAEQPSLGRWDVRRNEAWALVRASSQDKAVLPGSPEELSGHTGDLSARKETNQVPSYLRREPNHHSFAKTCCLQHRRMKKPWRWMLMAY